MMQLSLKAGMKLWKGKGPAADKSDMKHLNFREIFKPKHYRYLNEYQKKIILESQMFSRKIYKVQEKVKQWQEETSKGTSSPKKILVH